MSPAPADGPLTTGQPRMSQETILKKTNKHLQGIWRFLGTRRMTMSWKLENDNVEGEWNLGSNYGNYEDGQGIQEGNYDTS